MNAWFCSQFLPLEDKLCQEGEVPHVRYTPMFGGTRISRERPMTVSGKLKRYTLYPV